MYGVTRSSKFSRVRKNGDSVVHQYPTTRIRSTSSASQRPTTFRAKLPAELMPQPPGHVMPPALRPGDACATRPGDVA